MKDRMEAMERRMDAIDAKFKGSERDYNKSPAGNTTEPNEMEVHQPDAKKKKLSMLVAMMKTKGNK